MVPRAESAAAAARAPRIDAKRFRADLEGPRYRAVKSPDRGDPGYFSWIVFDMRTQNAHGEYTYLCDCIDRKTARLICDALNGARDRKRFVAEAASAEREAQKGRSQPPRTRKTSP